MARSTALLSYVLASLLFAGCAQMAADRTDASSTPMDEATQAAPVKVVESVPPMGSVSSLEAFRRGEAADNSGPLANVYFDFDRYDLRDDARETLRANAEWLKRNPYVRIQIEGHADERGTNEYNLALGARRADAAKKYLVALGISEEQISTISYGEEVPACTEQSEECWQRNRRDRFVVIRTMPAL